MSHARGGPKGNFDLGKYIIVKLEKANRNFEMIADPNEAWKAKQIIKKLLQKEPEHQLQVEEILNNSDIDLESIFPTYDFFLNVKKGDRVTEADLENAFATTDPRTIAAYFLIDGDFAWTKAQRDQWLEKKRKQIINILARNSINPQTKRPHPPNRIEKALEEARVSIDINKPAEEQIDAIVKRIQTVIPIRIETIQMAVKIPAEYAAKAYNTVEQYAQVKQSEWQTDGSWIGMISLPAGLQMELLDKLNKLTHGRMQSKLIQK
ncbi:MAG: ribosome assembly factor SBDS [Promethearchaeia archaeon]|nr:MAG: ribosome assembly factor SBDS [Candidatus Lokiarchaeia archaeon]